jgi:hypothetical protein
MKTTESKRKNRIVKLFFGSMIGMMFTTAIVVGFNIHLFPNSHVLSTFWIVILWLAVLYSVIIPVQLIPGSRWSKWWSK